MPHSSKKKQLTKSQRVVAVLKKPASAIHRRTDAYLARRAHRSFRLTKRRDYKRSLKLPGFFAFTFYVNKTLWQYRKAFFALLAVYTIITVVLVGVGSQETYSALSTALQDTGSDVFQGNLGELGKAGLLILSISTTGLTATPTESQQIYIVIMALLVWLTTVWLLRNLLAGHKVKMRDGLYNAGAPIIPTFFVTLVLILQLIPVAIATIGYTAASSAGLLVGGVETMLFWFAASLLAVTSLYWITSTFFALIVVTLPGMYPSRALRTAGDMVASRRLRILLRILWMFAAIAIVTLLVLVPVILIDNGLTRVWPVIGNIPIVPVTLMLAGIVAFIWGASYIYLLYRRVVEDDAKPA